MTGYFLLVFGLLLLFALIASMSVRDDPDASLFNLFALDRYGWYGEFKADVRSAHRQLGRDRDRMSGFVYNNVPWVFAAATGAVGLVLTALVMIGDIPTSVKSAVAETLNTQQPTAQHDRLEVIETRSRIPDYVFTANDPSVAMVVQGAVFRREPGDSRFGESDRVVVPAGGEEIRAREPVDHSRNVRVFDRMPREAPAAVADDNQELVVVARPIAAPGNRVPSKQHDLIDEVITGEVRRQNNRIEAQVAGLHVEKVYPESTAAGQTLQYAIAVHNISEETIGRVRVEETIPEAASLLNTVPRSEQRAEGYADDGRQIWLVDRLEPDEWQTIHIELDTRELDSVRTKTRVVVRAAYSAPPDVVVEKEQVAPKPEPAARALSEPEPEVVRSRRKAAAQPSEPKAESIGRVRVEITGPKRARVGDNITLKFRLYNYGTERIDNASIRVTPDPRLRSESGDVWRVQIKPVLEPGQWRIATFRGKAVKAGVAMNRIDVLFGRKVVQSGNRRLEIVTDDE